MPIQDAKELAIHGLSQALYLGDFLKAKLVKLNAQKITAERNSLQFLEALEKAQTHGQNNNATGGGHLIFGIIIFKSA